MTSNPWDRRPEETDKAWIAFVYYRDSKPRSLEVTAKECGGTAGKLRVVQGWSGKHEWVSRCHAYDSWIDRTKTQPAVVKAAGEMAERHIRLARAFQGVSATALPSLQERAKNGKLRASEVAALGKAGVDIERVASGEPTSREEHVGDPTRPLTVRVLRIDTSKFPAPFASQASEEKA